MDLGLNGFFQPLTLFKEPLIIRLSALVSLYLRDVVLNKLIGGEVYETLFLGIKRTLSFVVVTLAN
jgi:hypothetical protein